MPRLTSLCCASGSPDSLVTETVRFVVVGGGGTVWGALVSDVADFFLKKLCKLVEGRG
jgi:hypothetical protein